jgi:hypothetical protein
MHMQRVRIGLTGLAFVFLLVLLGTAISRSGGDAPPAPEPQVMANGEVAEPNEPLAELGVAPGESAADNADNSANNSGK